MTGWSMQGSCTVKAANGGMENWEVTSKGHTPNVDQLQAAFAEIPSRSLTMCSHFKQAFVWHKLPTFIVIINCSFSCRSPADTTLTSLFNHQWSFINCHCSTLSPTPSTVALSYPAMMAHHQLLAVNRHCMTPCPIHPFQWLCHTLL